MAKRRFIPFVYVFLLLFSQQVAYTHAAWHAHEQALSHQHDEGDASLQGDLCGLHGAFSQVLGDVQADAIQFTVPPGVAEAMPHYADLFVALKRYAPLSRGPPRLS